MQNSAWQYVLGENYCTKVTDGTHDTPKQVASGRHLVTSKHIKGDEIDFDNAYFISEADFNEINKRSRVDQWDVIISMIGAYCGFCFIEKNSSINYAVKNVGLFKAGNELNAKWLYYYLNSSIGKANLEAAKGGSSQPYIALGALRNLPILTPIDELIKKKIVDVLDYLDEKIRINNHINAELQAMAKTLYDYWFVQFDFPDANGKPYKSSGGKMVYNAMLKREIPEGWKDKQLSQIANITMGTSPTGDSLNDIGEGVEFFQGSTDFGWQFPTVRQYTTQPVRMAKRGDILLSVRAPVGDLNVAHIDCCIGRGLAALNSKDGFDGFLFYVMQYFKTIFDRRNGEGTTFGSITKDDLHSLPLAYPPTALLKEYDKVVSKHSQMVFARSLENQQLAQLRDWLLPLLMNGQVTVA